MVIFLDTRKRLAAFSRTQNAARTEQQRQAMTKMRTERLSEFARLVHDEVLGTLAAAKNFEGAPPPALRSSATSAIASLDVPRQATVGLEAAPMSARAAVETVKQSMEAVAADIEIAVEGNPSELPHEVVMSLTLAALEAARNAAKHANSPSPPFVRIRVSEGLFEIRVIDHGTGYDLLAVGEDRLGTRQSILGRVHALDGGHAAIRSDGTGTRVLLSWQRPSPPETPPETQPDTTISGGIDSWGARIVLVLLWCLGFAGAITRGTFSFDVTHIAFVLMPLISVIGVTTRRERQVGVPLAMTTALCALVPSLLAVVSMGQYRYDWFVSFAAYPFALLVARGNRVIGGVSSAIAVLGASAWGIATGQSLHDIVTLLALPIMAALLGWLWTLGASWLSARTRQLSDEQAVAIAAAAASRRIELEVRNQMAAISKVARPRLEAIVRGEPLNKATRRRLTATEGHIRDRIRVPRLHLAPLQDTVWNARLRGVEVTLIDSNATSEQPLPSEVLGTLSALLARTEAEKVTIRV